MCFILTNLHKNENIYSQIMLHQRFLTDTSFVHFVEDGTKIKISTYSDLATFNVKIFYIMKNISVMKNLPRRRFLLYWCHLLSFCYAGPKAVKLAKIQQKLFWKLSWFSIQVVFRPCLYVQLFYLSQNENMWPCVRRLAVPALFFFIVTSPVENMAHKALVSHAFGHFITRVAQIIFEQSITIWKKSRPKLAQHKSW